MQSFEVELPSNKKFGFFISLTLTVIALHSYINDDLNRGHYFAIFALLFFAVSFIKADILQPLNKLWLGCGLLLGKIFQPIVMGTIFFGLFMPLALMMRLIGRDELKLQFKKQDTYWNQRDIKDQLTSFEDQF